jgi:hypothetical protein
VVPSSLGIKVRALLLVLADQADALVVVQRLVAEAIAAGVDTVAADALSTQVQLYHSAAQIGITQTVARSHAVMKKHNALARRLLDRQDDNLRFTRTGDFSVTSLCCGPAEPVVDHRPGRCLSRRHRTV